MSNRKWTFEEWEKTFDAIAYMRDKSNMLDDKMKYSKMMMEHCYLNYERQWSRGL